MTAVRRVKLFKNGRNQAVRIPREFELPGNDAIMIKDGDVLMIRPVPKRRLLEVLSTLEDSDEVLPAIEDVLPEPVHL